MELRLDRLADRLAVLKSEGISARQISMAVTGRPDLIRHLLKGGQADTRGDNILRLAAAVRTSVDYLYGLSDDMGEPPKIDLLKEPVSRKRKAAPVTNRFPVGSRPSLPVRYIVQAGAWIEVDEEAAKRIVSPPVSADSTFPHATQWLELVRGDSVDLIYPEGTFVHVVNAIEIGYSPRDGDFVVVERLRQQGGLRERSLKQVSRKGRKVELWPRSRNPKWNTPLSYGDGSDTDEAAGGATAEIVALVLGGYLPARR